MPPTLLLIRHAQALHNVSNDWSIHDPPLSKLGEGQCLELQESLKASKIGNEVDLIVVSPMWRTLQTATIGLDYLIQRETPVLLDANWQENCDKPCDTGSPTFVLEKDFPQYDFSKVDPSYPDKTTNLSTNPYAFTKKAILARGQTCLRDLYSRPEKVIAVRVFEYDEEKMKENSGKFILKESEETETKGGGMGRSVIGVFEVKEGDFPPEVEEHRAKTKGKIEELDEASKQKPAA